MPQIAGQSVFGAGRCRGRSEYTAIVRDKLLRCPMLVVCSRNQDATTNAQIGLAQKYNRIVTTLDGLKKAVSEGDDLVS